MSGLKLLVSDHHGVYIPQVFVESYDEKQWNLTEKDIKSVSAGPDAEFNTYYWEHWDSLLDKAYYTDENGNIWNLYQDGDLWAYCPDLMNDEEYKNFFGEERD